MKTRTLMMMSSVVAALLALTGFADPIISIDLGAGTSVGSGTAGVVATDGWQQLSGFPNFGPSAMNYSDGSASGATLIGANASGNFSSIGAATTDGDYSMFNRNFGIQGSASLTTLTVANLSLTDFASGYDVYLYFAANANPAGVDVTATYSISNGSTTYYIKADETQASYQGSYIQATSETVGGATLGNYVKFSGLTTSSFTISSQNALDVTGGAAGFSGLQIVGASAIPEPSTLGLLLAGLAGVAVRALRKNA